MAMANLLGIARPYALAAFECARNKQQLPAWKAFLEAAAYTAEQPDVIHLLANPELSAEKLFALFHSVLESLTNAEQKNFLLLLAENKRLAILPEIADLFKTYYASLEKVSAVRIVTAIEMHDEMRHKLSQSLTKRIHREVTLECEIDPSIIGGAVIYIGDRVIDGSVRGKLMRLLESSLR